MPDVGSGDEALDTAPDEHDQLPIKVSIELIGEACGGATIWLCPLLEDVQQVASGDRVRLSSLDGHVVVWSDSRPFICCFSHGGNPPTHTTGQSVGYTAAEDAVLGPAAGTQSATPSITAGSSDGIVRLYFRQSPADTSQSYNDVRFVTTVQNNAHSYTKPDPHAVAVSYPFCVAGSGTLCGRNLSVTLEVRYNSFALPEMAQGRVFVCCQRGDRWLPMPTYHLDSLGTPAVATYFDEHNEADVAFFHQGSDAPAEQFQLWWIKDKPGRCAND